MSEPRIMAAPHEHPWAEDEEGRCILCGIRDDADRLERHMRGMAALIDELRAPPDSAGSDACDNSEPHEPHRWFPRLTEAQRAAAHQDMLSEGLRCPGVSTDDASRDVPDCRYAPRNQVWCQPCSEGRYAEHLSLDDAGTACVVCGVAPTKKHDLTLLGKKVAEVDLCGLHRDMLWKWTRLVESPDKASGDHKWCGKCDRCLYGP